jgi:hypothetical protein
VRGVDLLSSLRLFTAFATPRVPRSGVPWRELSETALLHGVAPIVAYNLELRLGGAGAPEDVRDRLMSVYQGSLGDNVFKLVNLKRLLSAAGDVPVVLLEAAAYADTLYPHVAFRPVPDLHLWVRPEDHATLFAAGRPMDLKPDGEEGGAAVLSDGRTRFLLHPSLFPGAPAGAFDAVAGRGIAAKVFGTHAKRPSLEDALLTHVALLASRGFDAPLIEFVDLREIVLGSPSQGGTYESPPDGVTVRRRAEELEISRALYCALTVLARFFPVAEDAARSLVPEIARPVRALLDAAVVEPTLDLHRTAVNRGAEAVRRLLAGG